MSDEQGNTASIALYAPDKEISFISNSKIRPYETYSIEVRLNAYHAIRVDDVQIFADEHSYLPVTLYKTEEALAKPYTYQIPEHLLFHAYGGRKQQESKYRLYDVMCKDPPFGVSVPDQILVHVAPFNQKGKQLCIPFLYYLKNVACSHIYPTWSFETIKANIWMELSFIMHRIQTSWYAKQGFTFDITGDPNEDFLYVENRNLHQTICKAVDEVFHEFIQGIFYQKTCMANTHCKLNQYIQLYDPWILFDLGKKGYNAAQIITSIANCISSYSSQDTKVPMIEQDNDTQVNISQVQTQLQKIANSYTSVSSLKITGYMDEPTNNAIMDVQRLLGVPIDGVLSVSTRKLITQIYDELLSS